MFGTTYSDGLVIDYNGIPLIGNARISAGITDSITFYNNGIGVNPIFYISYTGSVGVGNINPTYSFDVVGTGRFSQELFLTHNPSPTYTTQSSGVYTRTIANRTLLSTINPYGEYSPLQPLIARNQIAYFNAIGNTTSVTYVGIAPFRTIGTT